MSAIFDRRIGEKVSTRLPVTFEMQAKQQQSVAARFVASPEPKDWITAVLAWELPQEQLRFLIIPTSRTNHHPQGALVYLASHDWKPHLPFVAVNCVDYQQLGQRLYLPSNGRPNPPLTEEEIDALLSPNYTYVWRPNLGLIAFGADDSHTLSDLISCGKAELKSWDYACPGTTLAPRLISIGPAPGESLEMMLQRGGEDIGKQQHELDQLPPSPNEPSPGWMAAASRAARRGLANIVQGISHLLNGSNPRSRNSPNSSSRPPSSPDQTANAGGLWNKAYAWAASQLQQLNEGIAAAQNRQIERLLHMLDTNPDKGLRHAIGLNADENYRGIAGPSDQLDERDINFDLARLDGGGPAAFWYVNYDYQLELRARYQKLANRELMLGRHRRAAYIFAELLGDYVSAAGSLKEGEFYHEAALIYRHKLNQNDTAAQCYEQAGLWNDAIELYIAGGKLETAGDLYHRTGQPNQALVQYERAVENSLASGDVVTAARITEQKLMRPEDAIQQLIAGWEKSNKQARRCLQLFFQATAKLGKHDLALTMLHSLPAISPKRQFEAAAIAAETAESYPHGDIRHAAADCTRILVAAQANTTHAHVRHELLGLVRDLAPEDKLLARDCARYAPQQEPQPTKPTKSSRRPSQSLTLLGTTACREADVTWQTAAGSGNTLLIAGWQNGCVVMERLLWRQDYSTGRMRLERDENAILSEAFRNLTTGQTGKGKASRGGVASSTGEIAGNTARWKIAPAADDQPILLALDAQRDKHALLHVVGAQVLSHSSRFAATDVSTELHVGPVAAVTSKLLGADRTGAGETWLLDEDSGSLRIGVFSRTGTPQFIQGLTDFEFITLPVPMVVRRRRAFIASNRQLKSISRANEVRPMEFYRPITRLVASIPQSMLRLGVSFDRGAAIVWPEPGGEFHQVDVATGMDAPCIGFEQGGFAIAAQDDEIEVYCTRNRQAEFVASRRGANLDPIAVVKSPHAGQFVIVSKRGEIFEYQLKQK